MYTFTINPGRGWFLRVFGRHPLVRGSDRLEAIVMTLVMAAAIVVVPVAGAIGTAVHDSRAELYTRLAATRHEVSAEVLADTTRSSDPYDELPRTQVRWKYGDQTHTEMLRSGDWRKAGDHLSIWVNDRGDWVSRPPSSAQAVVDAVAAAVSVWLMVVVAGGTLMAMLRIRLNAHRYAAWERELDDLAGNGGNRSNRR